MSFTLTRTASGKITRYVANDATDPFDLDDWTPTNATESLSSGDLQCTMGTATAFGFLRHDGEAERGKIMVHALITRPGSENNHAVVATHLVDNSNFSYASKRFNGATPATRAVTLVERVANVTVSIASQDGVVNVTAGTYTKLAVFRDGATKLEGYSFDDDLRNTLTADLVETEGRGGFGGNQTSAGQSVRMREYYEATDEGITVSGLAAGNKCKVLDAGDVVLAEATESDGTASVDMLEVWPSAAVVVIVTDSADNELVRITPSDPTGVWGGDTYALTGPTSAIAGYRGVFALASSVGTSTAPWFPVFSGDYWVGVVSTDNGNRFTAADDYVTTFSASRYDYVARVEGDYIVGFDVAAVPIAEIRNWRVRSHAEELDDSEMGSSGWDASLAGVGSWDAEADMLFVIGDDGQKTLFDSIIDGTELGAEFYPTGSSSDGYYGGTGFLGEWDLSAPRDGALASHIVFEGNGVLTRST